MHPNVYIYFFLFVPCYLMSCLLILIDFWYLFVFVLLWSINGHLMVFFSANFSLISLFAFPALFSIFY